MSTTPRIAPRILERDNYACQYCGVELGDEGVDIGVDHVVPVSWYQRGIVADGNMDAASNLVTCCNSCNGLKRDMNLEIYAIYLRGAHGWTVDDARALRRRVRAALRRKLPL